MDKKKLRRWYFKWIQPWIPMYGLFSVITCFVWNTLIYSGTQILMADAKHYDLTSKVDQMIPFDRRWIFIYIICFGFWAFNYILIVQEGKEHWFRFASADMISRFICGICFICIPTTNVRPIVEENDIAGHLVHMVYAIDPATNLFPSIHCLVSWLCFVGIRKSKKVPLWYKIFSCIFALLVCASTQFTKQHFMIDAVVGVLLAEFCYYGAQHGNAYRILQKIFGAVNKIVFGELKYGR